DAGGRWVGFASLAGVLLLALAGLQGYSVIEGTKNADVAPPASSDWRNYGNSPGGTRFAAVDQINVENVSDLKEVWRYRTRVPYDFKNTPLQVGNLVYICTAGNTVIALNGDTGSEVWRTDTGTDVPGAREGIENASTFA